MNWEEDMLTLIFDLTMWALGSVSKTQTCLINYFSSWWFSLTDTRLLKVLKPFSTYFWTSVTSDYCFQLFRPNMDTFNNWKVVVVVLFSPYLLVWFGSYRLCSLLSITMWSYELHFKYMIQTCLLWICLVGQWTTQSYSQPLPTDFSIQNTTKEG